MIRSILGRATLLQQANAALILLLFAGSSLWLTGHTLREDRRTRLDHAARRLVDVMRLEWSEEGGLLRSARIAIAEGTPGGMSSEVRDSTGALLASSLPPDEKEEHRPRPRGAEETRTLPSIGGTRILVRAPDEPIEETLAALGRALFLAALPLWLASLLFGRLFVKRALRPLREMGARTRALSPKASVRTLGPPTGLRELDELQGSFDQLLERLDDARQADRRFAVDASHELRTPLTVLSGELELALEEPGLPPQVHASLDRSLDQVRRMRDLAEALLLIHRGGGTDGAAARFEPVNVSDTLREAREEILRRRPARAGDLTVTAPDEAIVSGSPALLRSAAINLLDNALKFSENGTPVNVQVEAGERVRVQVDDAGPGIARDDRERVFDLFFRGSEARSGQEGFGLGLAILREVARTHGGDISVGDSPLGGARFVMDLPGWSPRA